MTNVNSGRTADLRQFSYDDGATIQQYGHGENLVQHWFFEYAGNGYFYIRSRWSNKCVSVRDGAVTPGAPIVQRSCSGTPDPTVAAAEPTVVTASATAVSVQLNWTTNTEPDLAGYRVLRAMNRGGPYDIVARGVTHLTRGWSACG